MEKQDTELNTVQIAKLENINICLLGHIINVSKTKLLKLLYSIDMIAIKKNENTINSIAVGIPAIVKKSGINWDRHLI